MNLHHQLPKPDLKRLSYLDFGIKSQIPRGRGQPEIPNTPPSLIFVGFLSSKPRWDAMLVFLPSNQRIGFLTY